MEENQADYNQPAKKRKFNILTNPTVMGWIAIIGLPLGAWGIYLSYAFNREARPVYQVVSDVIVTQRRNSKIKVFFDSLQVENVQAVTLILWNAGNDYLDKTDFSNSKPITIYRSTPVKILEANILKTTRSDLNFLKEYRKGKHGDYVDLIILGDEGFESNDGVKILILYTGNLDGVWSVNARIKGHLKGIEISSSHIKPLDFLTVFFTICMSLIFYSSVKDRKVETWYYILRLVFMGLVVGIYLFLTGSSLYSYVVNDAPPEALKINSY